MAKSIIYDSKAKEKILAGVNKLEKAVTCTLGPAGKNVIIDEFGTIHSTRDGVTVAKSVILKDKFENLGVNAIREVAEKSADRVGDGTTTSTLLAASIFRNGLKYVSLGSNATQIKNGIKKAAEKAVELVSTSAKKIESSEDLKKVAIVSANGDEKIGSVISEIMSKIGNDGTIKVENGSGIDLTSKIVEGMVIDKSYESPYMISNPETMEAELDNPWILIVDKKIAHVQDVLGCLQSVTKSGRPLLVIAESYADEFLATAVMSRMRGGLNCVAITSPSYGENRRNILDDIAILCGGKVVSDKTGVKFEHALAGSGVLGTAQRVVVNKTSTIIIGGGGSDTAVTERAASLRSQIKSTQDSYEKTKLEERLARLTSGIGIITVGATTEAERKELRDRVDDAFCASKAAIRNGIVPGGGIALLNVKQQLNAIYEKGSDDYNKLVGDEVIGVKILCDSLDAPIRKIIDNAGLDSSLIVGKLVEMNDHTGYGYDALNRKYVNMIESGIIDPTEVVTNEITNAASVASLLLITDALIVDEPEDKPKFNQPVM
jgi:chaperonin GroEL